MEEKKVTYLDKVREEFIAMATEDGVVLDTAEKLAGYLTFRMLNSWKNGLRVGRQGKREQTVA